MLVSMMDGGIGVESLWLAYALNTVTSCLKIPALHVEKANNLRCTTSYDYLYRFFECVQVELGR